MHPSLYLLRTLKHHFLTLEDPDKGKAYHYAGDAKFQVQCW